MNCSYYILKRINFTWNLIMKCKCGTDNRDDNTHCYHCGERLCYAPKFDPNMHIPPEIMNAADQIANWAATNGFKDWQIGPVADRRLASSWQELHDAIISLIPERFRQNSTGATSCVKKLVEAYDKAMQENHEFRHGYRRATAKGLEDV